MTPESLVAPTGRPIRLPWDFGRLSTVEPRRGSVLLYNELEQDLGRAPPSASILQHHVDRATHRVTVQRLQSTETAGHGDGRARCTVRPARDRT